MPKHRLDRVNELIKRELSDIIRREFTFDAQLVTVQQVDVTPDIKNAHVYISVIGTESQQKHVVTQLGEKRVMLQHELAKRVVLKYTPQLHFKRDASIERGVRILNILDELQIPADPPDSKDEKSQ